MKKLHVFLALVLMSAAVFAQTRHLRDADRFLKNNRLDRAVASIRLAMAEPQNLENSNAWFSQAKIFTAVATTRDPKFKNLEPNAIPLAFESFQRAFDLDKSGFLKNISHTYIQSLSGAMYDRGTVLYSEQNFAGAASAFRMSVDVNALIDIIDTTSIFNVAICANMAGNREMAKEHFKRLVDLRADQPMVYIYLAAMYHEDEENENAAKYADLAAELFPENYDVTINAANIHLMLGNSERASAILNAMTERYADNPVVFFALGVAYSQMNMPVLSEQAYLRAIELKEDYFDAIFNLAAFYVTVGADIKLEADALPLSEQKKYDEMTEKSNVTFRKAIPMLEKALELQPNNIPVMSTLRDIYVHLRMMDRAAELSAQIEKLGN